MVVMQNRMKVGRVTIISKGLFANSLDSSCKVFKVNFSTYEYDGFEECLKFADTERESTSETVRFKHDVSPIAIMHVI